MDGFAVDPCALPALQQTARGCWKLAAGCAVTLHPRTAGELRIAHGRVWATLGSAGFALRGAAGALLRLAGGVLGLVPAGLVIAMNRLARRDRLMLG